MDQLLGFNKSFTTLSCCCCCCCCNTNNRVTTTRIRSRRRRNETRLLLLNNNNNNNNNTNTVMFPPTTCFNRPRRRNSVYASSSSSDDADANPTPSPEDEDEDEKGSFNKMQRLFNYLRDSLRKGTTGLDLQTLTNFFTHWKDVSNRDPTRLPVLAIYAFLTLLSFQKIYTAVRTPFLNRQAQQLSHSYMDALIPEPTPANIRKYKKGLWRKSMPKGLKMKKFIQGPEGTLIHDTSYVGEDAWDDEHESTVPKDKLNEIIDRDGRLNTKNKSKLQQELGLSG